MKRDQFKKIKEGRLDTIRRHLFDPALTDKQRVELRKVVRRRERLANEHASDRLLSNRINASIRASITPKAVRQTASRYRDVMSGSQRGNALTRLRNVVHKEEQQHLAQFKKSKDYAQLLKALRDLKTAVRNTKTYVGRK